jgi:hypothetical protein
VKKCSACGEEKALNAFPRDQSKSSGYASRCRACDLLRSKEQYRKKVARRKAEASIRAEVASEGKVRFCITGCGRETSTPRHKYCDACKPTKVEPVLAKTKARGYDARHVRERKRYKVIVESGEAACCRCGGPIEPGSEWDLDHTDDRTAYLGPAHPSCNRSAPKRQRSVGRRQSRNW